MGNNIDINDMAGRITTLEVGGVGDGGGLWLPAQLVVPALSALTDEQNLFTSNGKILFQCYGIIGAVDVEASGEDLLIGLVVEDDVLNILSHEFFNGPMPAESIWKGASLPETAPNNFSLNMYYIDGHSLQWNKAGVDNITQGGCTFEVTWRPAISGSGAVMAAASL